MAVGARAWLAVPVALTAFGAVTPAAADETVFRAETTATAVHVTITQQPASSLITASLFDDAVAYAAGDFYSGGSSDAMAASAFPGRLVVQGPALLCSQVFSCPTDPPAYPLLADASYPRRSHDRAPASGDPIGGGPFVVTPVDATATARAEANRAETRAGAVSLLAGTAGAVTVGSSAATSDLRVVHGALTVHVETTVSDVSIGDLVRITSIHAVDDLQLRPGSKPVNRPQLTVSGVTVAGHSATIDDGGIHVDGADGPSLTRRLARAGVAVRTVGAHQSTTRTGARSDTAGVQVDVALPVQGVPYIPNPLPPLPPPFDQIPELPGVNANGTYVGHVTLASIGAAGGFGATPDFGGDVVPPAAAAAPRHAHAPAAAPVAPAPPGGSDLVDGLTATPPETPPAVAPPQSVTTRLVDALSAAQIELLYAVLALGTAGLFIGWRLSVAARRRTTGAARRPLSAGGRG